LADMRLRLVASDPLGMGVVGRDRHQPRNAEFHRLLDDEIRARLLHRGEDKPGDRRHVLRARPFEAATRALTLARLYDLCHPLAITAVEDQRPRPRARAHHAEKVMCLRFGQGDGLPRPEWLVYTEPDLRQNHEPDHMSAPDETPEPEGAAAGTVADAVSGNWVDRLAPGFARPYLRLSRADRPIGTWLLLIPCWWGVAMAAAQDGWRLWDAWIWLGCALGAWLMRGAGCTWNDITDRDFDAAVVRTRSRPIPSGQVSVRQAVIWMAAQMAAAGLILLSYNGLAVALGLSSLGLVAIYPYAKRFTWWPQLFLGLAFNWGAIVAYAAHAGRVDGAAVLLYAAGIAWTLFYDTIYAHQDKEDDVLIGVKSTARLFGAATGRWLARFLVATVGLMTLAVLVALLPVAGPLKLGLALLAPWAMGWHLLWQMNRLDIDDPANCLRL